MRHICGFNPGKWLSSGTGYLTLLAVVVLLWLPTASAQITVDGSLGPAQQLVGPNFNIDAGLGTRAGNNLFHSFGQFNILTGESATFSGPSELNNIVSRVTGGQLSNIDGLLQSSVPGASLYLINPSGIVFGPNASVDVGGSLHLSSASYLRFEDGQTLNTAQPEVGGLSIAPVSAFGFLGQNPAPITVQGTGGTIGQVSGPGISAAAGATLSLTAGAINVDAGETPETGQPHAALTSVGGAIRLSAVSSPGELNQDGGAANPDVLGGPITLGGASLVLAIDGDGIVLRGGRIQVESEARLQSVGLDNTAGQIRIEGESIVLSGAASILTSSSGPGGSSDTELVATDAIELNLSAEAGVSGRVLTGIANFGTETNTGETGSIVLRAPQVSSTGDFNSLDVANLSETPSGNVVLEATENIDIQNLRIDTRSLGGVANSGDVLIVSPRIDLSGVAVFGSAGSPESPSPALVGQGGGVSISGDQVRISGGRFDLASGTGGAAGEFLLSADSAELTNTQVDSSVALSGAPGAIVLLADSSVALTDSFLIASSGSDSLSAQQVTSQVVIRAPAVSLLTSGIFAGTSGVAQGGEVVLSGDRVSLGDSAIELEARGTGAGTQAVINAGLELSLDSSVVSTLSRSGGPGGDILLNGGVIRLSASNLEAGANSVGASGEIVVRADSLELAAQSGIVSGSLSPVVNGEVDTSQIPDGNAGNLRIVVSGPVRISSQSLISTATSGNGIGGTITLDAESLRLSDQSSISTDSFSNTPTANAGDIRITLADSMELDGNSSLSTQTRTADGGEISLVMPNRLVVRDSSITTSVAGTGDGGNIDIDPDFIILDNGRILASAVNGNGGNIRLVIRDGGALLVSPNSIVNASSSFGVDGEIQVSAPERDVAGALGGLDAQLVDPDSLARRPCAAVTGERGRFVVHSSRRSDAFAGDGLARANSIPATAGDNNKSSQAVIASAAGHGLRVSAGRCQF